MHRFIMAQEGIPSFVQSLIILPKTRKYGKTFMMPLEQTIAGTPTAPKKGFMAIFAAIEAAAPARRLSRSQRTQQTGCKNYNDMLWARSDKALCSRVALQQKGCVCCGVSWVSATNLPG